MYTRLFSSSQVLHPDSLGLTLQHQVPLLDARRKDLVFGVLGLVPELEGCEVISVSGKVSCSTPVK